MEAHWAEYPWYRVIEDDSLEQGDILRDFEIPELVGSFSPGIADYEVDLQFLDVVVMTQTCDLSHGKARSVVLCPVLPLRDFLVAARGRGEHHWSRSDLLEQLRQGVVAGYHLLNDFQAGSVQLPLSIVDFHEIYSAAATQVRVAVSKNAARLRLCPPYREHLAQSFARFFMRVGLPTDISRDKLKQART